MSTPSSFRRSSSASVRRSAPKPSFTTSRRAFGTRVQVSIDGLKTYAGRMADAFADKGVDYAQLLKRYEVENAGSDRYSPAARRRPSPAAPCKRLNRLVRGARRARRRPTWTPRASCRQRCGRNDRRLLSDK